jgi:hypothetical protein
MKSVIDKKSKKFLFPCAQENYELGENQMFVDALPSEDLATKTIDENGLEVSTFDVKWNGKDFEKI